MHKVFEAHAMPRSTLLWAPLGFGVGCTVHAQLVAHVIRSASVNPTPALYETSLE